jgi:hypothetical protein
MAAYRCFNCHKISLVSQAVEQAPKCPSCGGTNGEFLSPERFKEGVEAGVYFNIDPKTGGPAMKKRR